MVAMASAIPVKVRQISHTQIVVTVSMILSPIVVSLHSTIIRRDYNAVIFTRYPVESNRVLTRYYPIKHRAAANPLNLRRSSRLTLDSVVCFDVFILHDSRPASIGLCKFF